jgi:hypothetical protein
MSIGFRDGLVFKLRDLSREYNLGLSDTMAGFFNYEAQKQYKKAMGEGRNYYNSLLCQEYSEHLFNVYSRAIKIKYGDKK